MTAALLVLAGAFLGFTAQLADGTNDTPVVFPATGLVFVVQEDGSDDVSDGSDVEAMRRAIESWRAPCSSFSFTYGGTDPSTAVDQEDGVNRVTFIEESWMFGGTVGFAPRRVESTGAVEVVAEVDVVMNGTIAQTFGTTGAYDEIDIQGLAVHELGHALGLWHSGDAQATMYFASKLAGVHARTPNPDDLAGLCWLYPASGARSCVTDADCPLFFANFGGGTRTPMRCEMGACVEGAAAGTHDCTADAHCASGVCTADRRGGQIGQCSPATCVVGVPCGGDGLCSDRDGTAKCYFASEDCVLESEACAMDEACVWDLDARFRCLRLCTEDSECGDDVCSGGYCRAPGPGLGLAECENGLECESLRCGGVDAVPRCEAGPSGLTDYVPCTLAEDCASMRCEDDGTGALLCSGADLIPPDDGNSNGNDNTNTNGNDNTNTNGKDNANTNGKDNANGSASMDADTNANGSGGGSGGETAAGDNPAPSTDGSTPPSGRSSGCGAASGVLLFARRRRRPDERGRR